MAGLKISALPPGGEIQNTDLLPVARGSRTFSVRGDAVFPIAEFRMGDNSVSNRALSANSISLDKIRTIPGHRVLGNNTAGQGGVVAVKVNTDSIEDRAITSIKIASGTIINDNISNNTINLNKIQQISANRVLGAAVAGNVIQTQISNGMIADNAVTSSKIQANEVKSVNIEDSAINRNKVANNEITFNKIQQIGTITNSVIGYTSANTNAQPLKIVNEMITDLTITGGKIANSTITTDKLAFSLSSAIPVGAIMAFYRNTAPDGWLACDGAAIPSQFTSLRALVGANTPNLQGQFIRGLTTNSSTGSIDPLSATRMLGNVQGDAIRNITGGQQTGHTLHLYGVQGTGAIRLAGVTGPSIGGNSGDTWWSGWDFDASRVVPTSRENRPVNIALLYCIKT